MTKYNLLSNDDGNDITILESTTFQESIEETLYKLGGYIIDEGDYFIGVCETDSNNTIDLLEQNYEDAQYELIENLGYYITSSV